MMRNFVCLLALSSGIGLSSCRGIDPDRIPPFSYSPDTARTAVVMPGVVHRYLWDKTGPWAIHVVEAKLGGPCAIELRTLKANDRVVGRETTTNLSRDFVRKTGRQMPTLVNADFFLFDPPGVPVGTQVIQGRLVSAGPRWPVVGAARAGSGIRPFISSDSLQGELRTRSGGITVRLVNRRPDSARVTMYNEYVGARTPDDAGVVEVAVSHRPGGEDIGTSATGVVLLVDTLRSGIPMDGRARVVFAARNEKARIALRRLERGDTVHWKFSYPGAPGPVVEMVGGFPLLLHPGLADLEKRWADRPASFIARNPRTAIGWRNDGTIILVTVDGRQPGYSLGMTLDEMVVLSRKLGASTMLNLDGGGSTAMVINRWRVNRPSDREGERPVANAIGFAASPGCRS